MRLDVGLSAAFGQLDVSSDGPTASVVTGVLPLQAQNWNSLPVQLKQVDVSYEQFKRLLVLCLRSQRICDKRKIAHFEMNYLLFVVDAIGFGATATGTGLFGQQQQQQQQSTGTGLFGGNTAFGAAKPMFGAATTTASTPFGGLATAGTGTTLFGQANQNKVSAGTVTLE